MRPEGGASISATNGFSSNANGSSASSNRKSGITSALNGHSSPHPSTNGSTVSHTNGSVKSPSPVRSPTYFGHDREEVTRILIQSLIDLGYNDAASSLSRESGYELESPYVAAFRNAILEGQWNEAEAILLGSHHADGGGSDDNAQGLVLADGADKSEMLFWLRQQKFLELLEQRELGMALVVLRSELTPLNHDIGQLHALSSLLMCPAEDLHTQAGWTGTVLDSRHRLLSELSKSISPSVMIPERRLAYLLDQVKQNQLNQCLYHNTALAPSLYSDHMCDKSQFPLHTARELAQHSDEVWYLDFSHDGSKLATTSRDSTVIIYDTATFEVLHKLTEHAEGVAYATWSPDDTKLITCSQDHKARVWDVKIGQCLLTLDHHIEPVTSAAWSPNGETFITGSLDRQSPLCLWSILGTNLHTWSGAWRVQDCAISPDGNYIVVATTEKRICVYDFHTREQLYSKDCEVDLTCISISRDSRYMLVNMQDSQIQMLDIEAHGMTVRRFEGQKQGHFVIRSSFGGACENFIISGSEDSRVYIWHKENGKCIEQLEGHHRGAVNAVAWNPRDPGMFASAGDDHKVRIWVKESALPANAGNGVKPRSSNGSFAITSSIRSTYDPGSNL